MRTYDIRRAIQAWRSLKEHKSVELWLQASEDLAGMAVYASLFEPDIKRLDLYQLKPDHRTGPIYLNVRRFMNLPEAVTMAVQQSQVVIYGKDQTTLEQAWNYPRQVQQTLAWPKKNLQLRKLPSAQ